MKSMYNPVKKDTIERLSSIVGPENVLTDPADLVCYARDKSMTKYSEWFKLKPEVVVLPASTQEVLEIVRLANREKIPITPRGGGTSFTGNTVPSYGGISLDLKRMNKIIEIDEDNFLVTAQAGIQIETLDRELRKHGVMYSDDPTSFPSATLGGRISTSGVGYATSRYGDPIDLVVGLEVVLPYGEVVKFGGGGGYKIYKSSVGYPLRYLLIGHLGTLGVITAAVVRIFPIPEAIELREIDFDNVKDAFKTAIRLYKTGINFALLAVSDKFRPLTGKRAVDPSISVAEGVLSFALMGTKEEVKAVLPRALRVCQEMGGRDLGSVSEHYETRHELDTAMPGIAYKLATPPGAGNWQCEEQGLLATLGPEYFSKSLEILKRHGLREEEIYTFECFSFYPKPALVTMYRLDERADDRWKEYMAATRELNDEVLKLGGTTSAAHGLGMRRLNEYIPKELGHKYELMKKIKKIFDPNNIMNPGKMMLDEAYK